MMRAYVDQMEMSMYMFAKQLLAQVAQDHGLDHGAMVKKYLTSPGSVSQGVAPINKGEDIPAPLLVAASQEKAKRTRKTNSDREMCQGRTAKGQPCKFAAQGGTGFCKKHCATKGSDKTPQAPRANTAPPVHNHKPGEVPPELCQVCDSHGDVTRSELPQEEFCLEETSIRDRLKNLLEEATRETEEPEPTATPEELLGGEPTPESEPEAEEEDEPEAEEVLKNKLAMILAQDDMEEDDE